MRKNDETVKDMANQKETDYTLPGRAESYWMATTPESNYPALPGDIRVDVAIIGGGIVGITSAFLLKQAGVSVAVIEADRIIKGVTGYTTAKITSQHNLIYNRLISELGRGKAKQYAESNQAAIEKIEYIVRSWDISCDFAIKPAHMSMQVLKIPHKGFWTKFGQPGALGFQPHLKITCRCLLKRTVQSVLATRHSSIQESTCVPLPGKFKVKVAISLRKHGHWE